MKMKIGLMLLSLLGVAGGAMAQDAAQETTPVPAESVAPPAAAQTQEQMAPSKPKRRQGHDMRRCLDLKTNEAIIRCAEPGRKP